MFTINGSERVCDGVCFWDGAMTESVFSKAYGPPINGSERVRDRVL